MISNTPSHSVIDLLPCFLVLAKRIRHSRISHESQRKHLYCKTGDWTATSSFGRTGTIRIPQENLCGAEEAETKRMSMAGIVRSCAGPPLGSSPRISSRSRSGNFYHYHCPPARAPPCHKGGAAIRDLCFSMSDKPPSDIPEDSLRESEHKKCRNSLAGRRIAFTTPLQYAPRLAKLLDERGAELLWCPTIVTEQTAQTRLEMDAALADPAFDAHGVAFTSREGIRALSSALNGGKLPMPCKHLHSQAEAAKTDDASFVVAALGKDAELLQELAMVLADEEGVVVIVPAVSTPQALVEALGDGRGRKLLCPVPFVDGLQEPPVVPHFLESLRGRGWIPVRVNSYVTRWLGDQCARPLLIYQESEDLAGQKPPNFAAMDALIFTSTAEIEGLLKSLAGLGLAGVRALQSPDREFLIAAHGPVTASGAERLGVKVDVVGKDFRSFAGVVNALEAKFCERLSGYSELPAR